MLKSNSGQILTCKSDFQLYLIIRNWHGENMVWDEKSKIFPLKNHLDKIKESLDCFIAKFEKIILIINEWKEEIESESVDSGTKLNLFINVS